MRGFQWNYTWASDLGLTAFWLVMVPIVSTATIWITAGLTIAVMLTLQEVFAGMFR